MMGGRIWIWRWKGVGALRMGRSGDIGGISCMIDGARARGCQRQNMVHGVWTPTLQVYRVVEIRACMTPSLGRNGLRRDTWPNGPTDCVAAPKQNLNTELFRRFPLTPDEF
jgi:hypothetical protein